MKTDYRLDEAVEWAQGIMKFYPAIADARGNAARAILALVEERRVLNPAQDLAMLGLQSPRYSLDEEYRQAVDDVLALTLHRGRQLAEGGK